MAEYNMIDLFAGCGGLAEGFEQAGGYRLLAAVEWEAAPRNTLARRMMQRWDMKDANSRIMRFDMQDSDRLFHGWTDDEKYGSGAGLDHLIGERRVDVVIGGPPCQAYSVAGRIRDKDGMRNDYRNYLFESYLEVIKRYQPRAFIFENVPGLLSAKPDGALISEKIRESFDKAGWTIPVNLKDALVDMADYGLPQIRKRLIILGLNKSIYGNQALVMQRRFYSSILPGFRRPRTTVGDAIGDLPKLYPLLNGDRGRHSHSCPVTSGELTDHVPRYHNERDIGLFRLLADDIASGREEYASSEKLKELYTEHTGRVSNIHKYHVLRADEPSTLIPAHLNKDGLRHIHPDPKQARSITIREAARLQGFPDDYEFLGTQGDKYRMIGNAVPPSFSKLVALALARLLEED